MASELIGNLYPTSIPGYDDAADIQAALRLYHYGSDTYDIDNANTANLVANSIAFHLHNLSNTIAVLDAREEARGIGSSYQATEPGDVADGYIWMDADLSVSGTEGYPTAVYNSGAPSNPTDGTLWVVKGSSPLLMKIYDSDTSTWKTIGA
jgi:hypothetical protein